MSNNATVKKAVKSLSEIPEQHHVAEIVHHGDKLTLPEGMGVSDAIELLERRRSYLEEAVGLTRTFNVFPWDGANAINIALARRFGWAAAEATPGFFGSTPPKMITIEVGPGQTRRVPWGRFSMPGIEGFVQTSASMKDGRLCFQLVAQVLRKDEQTIEKLFDEVEDVLKHESIYAGKAIKIRFRDDDGNTLEMPEPKFLDVSGVSRDMLVYSKEVTDSIETNLFTPIERVHDCIKNGIPVKRGVLLGGPYGTGKTLAATVASRLAVDAGVTYLYVPRADELADAIEFAKQYQDVACVIFCEDIDRCMSGERSVAMDDILNILDGIDTKSSRIITVLTTNHLTDINPAMLRPGRLDAIIDVVPPDAEAVVRLIKLYGAGDIDEQADLTPAAELLAGAIPAVIAEVVKRSKLAQLQLQAPGTAIEKITGDAILLAAQAIQSQVKLLAEQSMPRVAPLTMDSLLRNIVKDEFEALATELDSIRQLSESIRERVS
ncbi:AAA family ATPase [Pseudomonas aeruginosa]|uniref:AAA family ATPase n=1 Tax=Pseudomonas aeruginosa TaxID=287 RepID=UPI0021FDCC12|nr:cell division protein [Pseudomonas phage YMC17/07/R4900a]